jgi:predicted transcriptional regulator of viral defense system
LARIAARQYGLVTSVQIARVGLGRPAVANRVKDGRLHPLYRGVYAVGHGRLSREGRWLAAVLAAGDGAVLSHLAAAVHWKIWRRRWDGIDVTVPGQRRSRAGFRVHRCRNLDPRDTTRYQGIPITTPARTLVDLADTLTSHQLANVIHEAAFRNRFDETRTREAMQRAQGRPLNTLTSRYTPMLQAAPEPEATSRTASSRPGPGPSRASTPRSTASRSTSTGRTTTSWSRSTAPATRARGPAPRTRGETRR